MFIRQNQLSRLELAACTVIIGTHLLPAKWELTYYVGTRRRTKKFKTRKLAETFVLTETHAQTWDIRRVAA
jgi:hypothetical protein